MTVVVRSDLELSPLTRGVFHDFRDRVGTGDIDLRAVFREDAVPASEDQDALRRRIAAVHGRLQQAVELHRPEFLQEGADGLRSAVRDPLRAARRDFHPAWEAVVRLRRFPRQSGS